MNETLPQFDRNNPSSLFACGQSDAYFGREYFPHYKSENGSRVYQLNSEESQEYCRGYVYTIHIKK